MNDNPFLYYAYLSHCQKDELQAVNLRNRLERFRLPNNIDNEFADSRYLRPFVESQSDAEVAELPDADEETLRRSKCLLLVCSPDAAQSPKVDSEVASFIAQGRVKSIIPYIVAGVPMSKGPRECFPPCLIDYFEQHPHHELLGIDVHKVGRSSSILRVVSNLIDMPYSLLYDRQARVRQWIFTWSVVILAVVGLLFYFLAVPYSITVHVHDAQHNLPVVEMAAGNVGVVTVNGTEFAVSSLDTVFIVPSLPGYLRGNVVEIGFSATYYETESDTLRLGYGLGSIYHLYLHRDDSFAIFSGIVRDFDTQQPIADALVEVDDGQFATHTDQNGRFVMRFGLDAQSVTKSLRISAPGYLDYEYEDAVVDVDTPYSLEHR